MKWILPLLIILIFCPILKAQKSASQDTLQFVDPINPKVDEPPNFPGGIDAYNKFLSKNLKWPKNAEDVQGRVIVSFIVEKDGRLSDFKIEKSMGKDCDDEAIRVLKKTPRWIPAKKNGKAVRIRYFVPINFTLVDK